MTSSKNDLISDQSSGSLLGTKYVEYEAAMTSSKNDLIFDQSSGPFTKHLADARCLVPWYEAAMTSSKNDLIFDQSSEPLLGAKYLADAGAAAAAADRRSGGRGADSCA